MKKNIKSLKGISFIVLIITILVTVILMSAVILSIKDQHLTDSAGEVRFREKLESYRVDLEDYIAKKELEEGISYNRNLLNANTTSVTYDGKEVAEGENIFSILNSMTEEDSKLFQIRSGKLVYSATGKNFSKEEYEYALNSGVISYVTDGLIGYYEGSNNTGGAHSSNAIKWKDLSSKSLDASIINPQANFWTENSLYIVDENMQVDFPVSIPKGKSFTIEVIYVSTDDSPNLLLLNKEKEPDELDIVSIPLNQLNEVDDRVYYKVTYIYNAQEGRLSTYRKDHELESNKDLEIDRNISSISTPLAINKEYFTLRVYDRVLTQNELTINENIDKQRFEL